MEINTIASAFGPMGSLTQSLHRAILSKLDFCPEGFSEAGIPNEPNSGKGIDESESFLQAACSLTRVSSLWESCRPCEPDAN